MALRTGAVDEHGAGNAEIAAQQAAKIGATIDPKTGWWFKDGRQLSHKEADDLVNAAGAGVSGLEQWGTGGIIDRNRNFVGNALKNIAPAAALIPGVGPLAAAGISGLASAAGSGLQHGTNLGDILKQGVTGAGEGYGASQALGAIGVGGGAVPTAAGTVAPTAGTAGTVATTGTKSVMDKLGGLLKPVGVGIGAAKDFLGGNNGLNALGVAQGVNTAQLGAKADSYANQAKDIAMQRWNAGQPLRDKGLAGLSKPAVVDLSALENQRRTGNVFAKPISVGG